MGCRFAHLSKSPAPGSTRANSRAARGGLGLSLSRCRSFLAVVPPKGAKRACRLSHAPATHCQVALRRAWASSRGAATQEEGDNQRRAGLFVSRTTAELRDERYWSWRFQRAPRIVLDFRRFACRIFRTRALDLHFRRPAKRSSVLRDSGRYSPGLLRAPIFCDRRQRWPHASDPAVLPRRSGYS